MLSNKGVAVATERHVRIFRNGRNQAVRIPREFELDCDEAIMRRDENRLVIEPIKRGGLLATREGLRIKAGIDEHTYAKGIKVTDEELATLSIERDEFHGEWNYRLLPRNKLDQS